MRIKTDLLFLILLFNSFLFASSQQLKYLNTSLCETSMGIENDCFSNNLQSYYLGVDLMWEQSLKVPSFSLLDNQAIEILLKLPDFSFRYLGISGYVMTKSDGIQVFAEVTHPIDFIDLTNQCKLSSPNLLWGSLIRIIVSPDPQSLHSVQDEICTSYLSIPGSPYTNLSKVDICLPDQTPFNLTQFSVIVRLTLPQVSNQTEQMNIYLNQLDSFSKVQVYFFWKNFSCELPTFSYPKVIPRVNVTSEIHNPSITKSFKYLVDQVIENVLVLVPHATIRYSETFPWFLDGFTCINNSFDCQGSTSKSTYMPSNLFNVSSRSNLSIIVIGCVHNDFVPNSFYSSMGLYKLGTSNDLTSGVGISSVIDEEQRSSANGYSNNNAINLNHFFVVQFAFSCLPLVNSTLCKPFLPPPLKNSTNSTSETETETLFVIGRSYASPSGPLPDSLINDVVLYITY